MVTIAVSVCELFRVGNSWKFKTERYILLYAVVSFLITTEIDIVLSNRQQIDEAAFYLEFLTPLAGNFNRLSNTLV